MRTEVTTESEQQTQELAKKYAGKLEAGDVVCLDGQLGVGKTQFVKGLSSYFGIDPEQVHSPTFTLIHEYEGTLPIYHFDCYRIENPSEVLEIGAEEYLYGEGVSIIEWPKKIAPFVPKYAHWIRIESLGPSKRKFIFNEGKK